MTLTTLSRMAPDYMASAGLSAKFRGAVRERARIRACFLHQTSKCISASVRHADATMDQMMVTQLI